MTNAKLGKLLADLDIKEPIATTIGEDLEFHGKLVIKNGGGIAIFGKVVGEIESDGVVVVGEGGIVTGTLSADVVAIAGTVDNSEGAEDSIHARASLVLGATARIGSKSIHYGSIEMERGCRIDGNLKFVEPSQEVIERRESRMKLAVTAAKSIALAAPAAPASLEQPDSPSMLRPLPVISPADRGGAVLGVSPPQAGVVGVASAAVSAAAARPVAA